MSLLEQFAGIVEQNVPLAPLTRLRLGGPAEYLARPRTSAELAAVISYCASQQIPVRALGGGAHVLVPDEGVRGVVLRPEGGELSSAHVEGNRVRVGAATPLAELIAQTARHGLAGLETLVGIPSSVGGAVRCNVGDKSAAIGQLVRAVEVMTESGQAERRSRDELRFVEGASNIDDPIVLFVELELERDRPEAILKRLRKAWITRAAAQPYTFQASARMFRRPAGQNVTQLIERAGASKLSVGGAEVSDRNPNYLVANPGTLAYDAVQLLTMVQTRVREATGVNLERELLVW